MTREITIRSAPNRTGQIRPGAPGAEILRADTARPVRLSARLP